MQINVFNVDLYERLAKVFGPVVVVNHGVRMASQPAIQWTAKGPRRHQTIQEYGETYKVNCPFCSDTRKRLYIPHRFGQPDHPAPRGHPLAPLGHRDNLFLAKCFNEECTAKLDIQKRLYAMLYPAGGQPPKPLGPAVNVVSVRATPPQPITLQNSVPILELPTDHPACQYLASRGFNPLATAHLYELRFCDGDRSAQPAIREPRIVIPIRTLNAAKQAMLVGWQARMMRPISGHETPKYLTAKGMQKSRLLYGPPQATASTQPPALVEGILDAWKVGPQAMALLGKTISHDQVQLLIQHFRGRKITVLLDSDAAAAAEKVANQLREARRQAGDYGSVVVASCPPGRKDPGECSSEEIAAVLEQATSTGAAKAGGEVNHAK